MDAEILLDSSVIIDFFRKRDKTASTLFGLIDQASLYVSVLTVFEVRVGVKSGRQQRDYDLLMQRIEVLPLDEACMDHAVDIYRDLKSQNALIGLADLLIAASALRYGLPVATLNRKHFERITSLPLVSV